MRIRLSAAITIVSTLLATSLAASALACPTVLDDPPRRRPVVNNVSFQASELLQRASALETTASSHDRTASALDREAETFAARARILRQESGIVNVADRGNLLAAAAELAERAEANRIVARGERTQASELRAEARVLRDRASQLVRANGGGGGGGGWRRPTDARSSVI